MISSRVLSFTVGVGLATVVYGSQQTVVLPPVKLAPSETAAINLTSLASDYPGWGFGGSCQASVTFHGPDGSILGSTATFTVGNSGRVFSSTLPYALADAKTSNVVITARIVLTPASYTYDGPAPPIPDCAVGFSLETYDTVTGVAHTLVAGQAAQGTASVAIVGAVFVLPCLSPGDDCEQMYSHELTPTQFIVTPPVGLAATETAQIDVAGAAAGYAGASVATCDVSVTFYGADGSAVGAAINFTLGKAEQIFSAALPYSSAGSTMPRSAVRAQIALTAVPFALFYPPSVAPPCTAAFSLKTFDTATGLTHVYVAGQTTQDTASVPTAGPVPAPSRHRLPGR